MYYCLGDIYITGPPATRSECSGGALMSSPTEHNPGSHLFYRSNNTTLSFPLWCRCWYCCGCLSLSRRWRAGCRRERRTTLCLCTPERRRCVRWAFIEHMYIPFAARWLRDSCVGWSSKRYYISLIRLQKDVLRTLSVRAHTVATR